MEEVNRKRDQIVQQIFTSMLTAPSMFSTQAFVSGDEHAFKIYARSILERAKIAADLLLKEVGPNA